MSWSGDFEDCMGLASEKGAGSSRAFYQPAPPAPPIYLMDKTFDFIYLSMGKVYKLTTEGVEVTLTFKGKDLDIATRLVCDGRKEFWPDIFQKDPIKWSPVGTDDPRVVPLLNKPAGFFTFSKGNVLSNPHLKDGIITIVTVSGKTYIIDGYNTQTPMIMPKVKKLFSGVTYDVCKREPI